jgi:hypothetical protein
MPEESAKRIIGAIEGKREFAGGTNAHDAADRDAVTLAGDHERKRGAIVNMQFIGSGPKTPASFRKIHQFDDDRIHATRDRQFDRQPQYEARVSPMLCALWAHAVSVVVRIRVLILDVILFSRQLQENTHGPGKQELSDAFSRAFHLIAGMMRQRHHVNASSAARKSSRRSR